MAWSSVFFFISLSAWHHFSCESDSKLTAKVQNGKHLAIKKNYLANCNKPHDVCGSSMTCCCWWSVHNTFYVQGLVDYDQIATCTV